MKKDVDEALRWLYKAAEMKNPRAMLILGKLFLEGESVKEDVQKAKEWLQKAAALGDYAAEMLLKELA